MGAENEISAEDVIKAILEEKEPEYVLDGRTIKGKFDLRHRIISVAIRITNCTFEDEVDLSYAEFKQRVNFTISKFKSRLRCNAICRKDLIFIGVVFEKEVIFNNCQCNGDGHFAYAKFDNPNGKSDFSNSRFIGNLNYTNAIFMGWVAFNNIQCECDGDFINAKFKNTDKIIQFCGAKFGGSLDCTGAEFKGRATFNGLQCKEGGFFMDSKFGNTNGKIDFTYAKIGVNLEFQQATFVGEVDFLHTQISRTFVLENTKFQNNGNLSCMDCYNFSLMDSRTGEGIDSLPFDDYVDLRRFSFTVFHGTEEQQKHVLSKQAPDKFSMDPYLQFEKYYSSIGDDLNAKKVYFEGRKKLHENARHKTNPDINWSKWKLRFDWLNWLFLGYGVRLWHTFVALAILLFFGTYMFWSDDAMIPKSINAKTSGSMMAIESSFQEDLDAKTLSDGLRQRFKDKSLILSQDATIEIDENGKEWNIADPPNDVIYKAKLKGNGIRIYNSTPFAEHLLHRFGYSLHMLLPIVNLRIADDYKFPSDWGNICSILRGFYTIFHIIAGWILIPLLISALAGVLKK